ncbi:MAG: ComEC/Rec2 family competence protein, partial [Clostridia bacterium]|nr:ComEC/Rec2 family competence protein [Clostridia bacterium]
HLSVVVMLLYSLIKRAVKNRYVCAAAGCAAVFCFCAVADFPYSAVRSGLMLCFAFLASAFSARNDPFTSLFAALGLITVIDPFATVSLSLQLSFLCTLGMICVGNSYESGGVSRLARFTRSLFVTPFVTSVAVVIFTLPAILYNFGSFSLYSPLSTMLCVLLFPLLLGTSYLFCIISAVLPFAGEAVGVIVSFISGIFIKAVRLIAKLPFASQPFYPPAVPVICAVCAVAALTYLTVRKNHRKIAFRICCAAIPLMLIVSVLLTSAFRKDSLWYCDSFGGFGVAVASGGACAYIDSGSAYGATDTIYASGFSVCKTLVITSVGKNTPKLIRYFAKVYGTDEVYIPIPSGDNGKSTELFEYALNAARSECVAVSTYDRLFVRIGDMSVTADKTAVVIRCGNGNICIAKKYIYDGAHEYDKIVLPSAYYPKPKGSIDMLAQYYCVAEQFPAGNTTFIRRNECVSLIP